MQIAQSHLGPRRTGLAQEIEQQGDARAVAVLHTGGIDDDGNRSPSSERRERRVPQRGDGIGVQPSGHPQDSGIAFGRSCLEGRGGG